MLFLLRCLICLSVVYASILGFTAAGRPTRPEVDGATASRARAVDTIASGARTLWSKLPVEPAAAAFAALSRLGVSPRPDPSAIAGPRRPREATDAAALRHR